MSQDIHSHLIEVSEKHCKPLQKLLQKNGVIDQKLTAKREIVLAMSGKLSQFQFGVVH